MKGLQRTDRPVWTAGDGTEFTDEAAAIAHQAGLDVTEEAERYVATIDTLKEPRGRTNLLNRIVGWERWKALNGETSEAGPAPTEQ